MHIALWSTGYCRGSGGTEQMVNALLRRLSLQGLKTSTIDGCNRRSHRCNLYLTSLPDEFESFPDTLPNPLLCQRPLAFFLSLLRYAGGALRLIRFLRRNPPTIVHLHLVTLDVFLLVLYKRVFKYR